jgi:hypothetical protein
MHAYRRQIGDIEVTALSDGVLGIERAEAERLAGKRPASPWTSR